MLYIILVLAGLASGVIGGMGMGGGTILIPSLVIFANMNQHIAQSINLTVFVPMSVITLAIHFKNKLVDIKNAVIIIIFASIFGVLGSFLASKTGSEALTLYFGVLLILLGFYQFITALIQKRATMQAK